MDNNKTALAVTTVLWVVLEVFWVVVSSQVAATVMPVETTRVVPWVLSEGC
jgi:hypothetical protein